MTCDEFRTMVRRDPADCTTAEIGATIKHRQDCPECHQFLVRRAKEIYAKAGPEKVLLDLAISQRAIARVRADPEAQVYRKDIP